MKTPKNVTINQIVTLRADEIRPGHILADGLVLQVRREDHYFFETPHATVHADPGDTLQVYAAITEDMAEIAREDYEAASRTRGGRA